ncbi:peptidase [Terriglobus sp. TAA 43]|uniref:peptidase n=1 Tax=Terriglobus sp. TAA 43 TaxID=278961 RepID=UPI000648F17A|nr:peptidase [Terriglobus sp. TAA 43]
MNLGASRRLLCCAAAAFFAVLPAAAVGQASPTPTGEPEVLHGNNGSITEVGVLGRAEYRIDIPASWNRSLVVFYHGYSESPFRFRLDGSIGAQPEQMYRRGFAVIQSGYSETGWALQAGYGDTESLRRYFVKKYGTPRETFAAGGSMGGALTMITMELNSKNTYTGGLNLCGAVGPSYVHLDRRFATRAAFDFYFPGLMGPLDPVPPNFEESEALRQKVLTALRAKPDAALAMRELMQLHSDVEVARAIGYFTYVIGDLQRKAGGNPFDNRNWIYTGTSVTTATDYALNDGVRRYAPDKPARDYLMAHYWPSGRLTKPMLALHTIYDPLIPANSLTLYASEVAHAGFADNLVQQYVHREGHCTFTPDEVGHAFDELLTWVHSGKAPQAGLLH